MFESTASDFDGRNNGLDIPRLDMATQIITLFGYFSFSRFSIFIVNINDTASIREIYHIVYYLLSEPDFKRHNFNFIKCTVYSKCQKKYKKT